MAGCTVLGDGWAVLRGVVAVVAAQTPQLTHVPEVVRVGSPRHFSPANRKRLAPSPVAYPQTRLRGVSDLA